jgi:hypothetical protein
MIRGFLLFFATLVFAGAMGFAFGVYVGPAVDAKQFRATVDAGVQAISKSAVSVVEKFKITPAKVPRTTAPLEGEAPSKEGGSDTSVQPQSDAGSGDLPANGATPPDHRAQDVAEPSSPVAEPQSGHSTPAINAEESVGSVSRAPPANRETDKQVQPPGNKPVANLKPKPKPAYKPVAKLKPRPKPAYKPVAKLKPKPKPAYKPVAKLKPKPKPNSEPEPPPKPVEQPSSNPPHPDGGDSWLPWLR